MSFQMCHCGWSKATTYQGLRTHQGKMGCTPKGMGIPESEQFRFGSYLPELTYEGPPIKVEEPLMNIFTAPLMSGSQQNTWVNQKDSGPFNLTAPVRTENGMSPYFTTTTFPGANDAMIEMVKSMIGSHILDRTNPALDLAGGAQPSLRPMSQIFGTQVNPAAAEVTVKETNNSAFQTQPQYSTTHQTTTHQTTGNARRAVDFSTSAQQNVPVSPYFTNTTFAGTDDAMIEMVKSRMGTQILDRTNPALDLAGGAQPSLRPMSQIFGTQVNPAAAEVTGKETNNSVFQTPPQYSTTHQTTTHQTTASARRALDFSTSAQQGAQMVWGLPTTTAQETVRPKEREMEKEEEDQKLQKARQDRMRADLQHKIQTREQKMAVVRSSVKACKGGLDAEWLEINNVFSEVMRVVEDSRQKALQPLEERRKRVKREAQDLVQKLQKEIDKLKMTIDELDKNPDLQVSPQTGLGETRDWRNVTVDTLFSFGTLRTTTSNMKEEIHKELEKLSSVELKRIPTFAVDVKLDPTTAHPCLVLSPDGKAVRDGGKTQKVPDAPRRFDMFGSILGLNRLTSGKSYWEVEVGNKTGWDLGVARRDAKHKGKLSLNPDSGYWVIVHYEEEKYAALTAPPVSLSLRGKPQKVGVFVDYEEGLVSFYHVTAKSHIYSFTECSFSDEMFPYFSPHLKQNERNSHPLIISAVKQQ